jgi:hypothetical protein
MLRALEILRRSPEGDRGSHGVLSNAGGEPPVIGRIAGGLGSLTLLAALAAAPLAAQAPETSCSACHAALGEARLADPAKLYAEDVHAAKGFGCVACHGGDGSEFSMQAMDPGRGYVGVPARRDIPQLCGRCHSDAGFMRRYNPALRVDQVAEYRSSEHGRRLLATGDPRVATCANCHPAHAVKPPSDPKSSVHPLAVASTCGACHANAEYMAAYGIPTDQKEQYQRSVHWQMLSEEGDLSAPTCNDCHGNHGAAPPGIAWVGNVCGQCHTVMAQLFSASFHSRTFALLGSPGCATCHRNHDVQRAADELLGVGQGATCAMCHGQSDNGGRVAAGMRGLIDSLNAQYAGADSILRRAERAGMEVSQALFDLSSATTARVSARTAVHSFALDSVRVQVEAGLAVTATAYARGRKALADLQFRRAGLAVSVLVILLLIVGLVLKIRELEGAGARGVGGSQGRV